MYGASYSDEIRRSGYLESKKVKIYTETITLGQFLKWAGFFEMGSQAKAFIQEGNVKVNGIVEKRRGRTLKHGDVVEFNGNSLVVDFQGESEV